MRENTRILVDRRLARVLNWLPHNVAQLRATIHAKPFAAFLLITVLLLGAAAVGARSLFR
jgi:hypothetical protein